MTDAQVPSVEDTAIPSSVIPIGVDDDGSPPLHLSRERRGRVTMDFTGPPLELPEAGAMAEDASTTEVIRRVHSSVPPDGGGARDAWVSDHMRRTTPPPIMGSVAVAPVRVPQLTPLEPLERWPGKPDSIPPAAGDALALVERKPPSHVEVDLMTEVRDRYALDDLSGALQAAELVLGVTQDHAEAQEYATSCRRRLEQLYAGRVGSMAKNPRVAVHDSDVRWLGLDHRAGFLLSQAAAATSVEELLDISGMPRLEALKTIVSLLDAGAIRLD